MGAVLGTDRWYSIDTSNRSSDFFSRHQERSLLLVSVEYDQCSRRTASHGLQTRATAERSPHAAIIPHPPTSTTSSVRDFLPARLRSFSVRNCLRSRIVEGVTSTSSSSSM